MRAARYRRRGRRSAQRCGIELSTLISVVATEDRLRSHTLNALRGTVDRGEVPWIRPRLRQESRLPWRSGMRGFLIGARTPQRGRGHRLVTQATAFDSFADLSPEKDKSRIN